MRDLRISYRVFPNDATIVDLTGRLTFGGGDFEFRTAMCLLLDRKHTKVIFNMKGLQLIDSSGVGELVSVYAKFRDNVPSGRIVLFNLHDQILHRFQTLQLDKVFRIVDSEGAAITSFDQPDDMAADQRTLPLDFLKG